jgi:diacylglycerol kinase
VNARPPATKPAEWRLTRTFGFAFRGLSVLLRTQVNARIHLALTVIVVGAGLFYGLSRGEWCAVVAAIGFVWTAEGLNTAIEAVVDLVSPEYHELAGRAKDLAAGAVLCAAIAAAIIGLLIFGPRICETTGIISPRSASPAAAR